MKPISNSLPSVSTYNSSFASPVWLAHEIVTLPSSIFTFTGYFFSFSIDEAEINDILSDPNTTQSNAAFYLGKEEAYTNRLTELYTLCNKQYEL